MPLSEQLLEHITVSAERSYLVCFCKLPRNGADIDAELIHYLKASALDLGDVAYCSIAILKSLEGLQILPSQGFSY